VDEEAWKMHQLEFDVKYQCNEGRYCAPYALLNVIGAGKLKAERLMGPLRDEVVFGLGDLARRSACIKYSLQHSGDGSIEWLLLNRDKQFVMAQDVHCVGVDCKLRLLYDCALPKVLHLNKASLEACGFNVTQQVNIRQVVHNPIKGQLSKKRKQPSS
jgi:hypothetical protein